MRKNRKVSKRMSRISVHTMHIGAVMLTFFAMIVLNLMASSRCSQLSKSITDKEAALKAKQAELNRNIVKWETEKSSSRLDHALLERGMSMNYAKPSQIVRMDDRGMLRPSQASVEVLRRRMGNQATASYEGARRRGGTRRVIR